MVPAPVGFQCPDCVKSASANARQARTLAGGAIHGDPMLVTKILVAINVVFFGLQLLLGPAFENRLLLIGLNPRPEPVEGVALGDYYRLITSAFLHTGITHLALNMLALWFVGATVEPRLGRWRYLTVYLLSALGGSVLSYVLDSPFQASVGASGAVFGLFGALFVLMVRLRLDVRGLIAIIAINVVIGFLPGFNINWRAHLGGMIVGALLTAAMVYAPQRSRLWVSIGASVAVVVLCAAATVWRTDQINSCLDGTQNPNRCLEDITYV